MAYYSTKSNKTWKANRINPVNLTPTNAVNELRRDAAEAELKRCQFKEKVRQMEEEARTRPSDPAQQSTFTRLPNDPNQFFKVRADQGLLGITYENKYVKKGCCRVVISTVVPYAPAHAAGLRVGDVITAINGKPVLSHDAAAKSTLKAVEDPAVSFIVIDVRHSQEDTIAAGSPTTKGGAAAGKGAKTIQGHLAKRRPSWDLLTSVVMRKRPSEKPPSPKSWQPERCSVSLAEMGTPTQMIASY